MGSGVIESLVSQIGRLVQSPDYSKPVEQVAPASTVNAYSKPIEQRTPPAIEATSKPIEQQAPASFSVGSSATAVIEQKGVSTPDPTTSRPIEQREFVTSSNPVEQKGVSTQDAYSRPIEQQVLPENAVDITQFDFIDLIFPECGSVKNPVNTNILWRIRDYGSPLDSSTIIFKVDGIEVQDSSDFSVTAIAGGFQLDYNPPSNFDFNVLVSVLLNIQDTAAPPNTFDYYCTWQTVPDVRGPTFYEIGPACDSTDVDVLEPIVFTVFDVGNGVDPDSINLSVEGINVCSGITLNAFTTSSGSGYTVTYEHLSAPFRYESEVTIALEASDLTDPPNSTLFICCFTAEESEGPQFMNFDPLQCETFVDNATGLSFEVYGAEQGVDISTLEVRIDDKLRKVFVRPRLLREDE